MILLIQKFYQILISIGKILQPFILLFIRLIWGWQFFQSGVGKFENIEPVISFFTELGIPFPLINAYLAATTECFGGLFLLVGLASRLVAIPLIVTMSVAYLTAHHDAAIAIFTNPMDFVHQTPFNFLLTSLLILAFGPGCISVDGILKRFFGHKSSEFPNP
jgi:putative oxidoreductase